MNFGDIVYTVIDGELREGEYRGIYYHGEHHTYGVWMTKKKFGQSKFKMFTFHEDEIFTDIEKVKKMIFVAKLSGACVQT